MTGLHRFSARVGLVGPGAIADFHARALAEIGAPIVAVAGNDPAETADFAARHGVPHVFTHPGELLTAPTVDAVVIASPSAFHTEQAMTALRAGKHVLCEVPVALSLDQARALRVTATESSASLMAANTLRYTQAHQHLRSLVLSGQVCFEQIIARSLIRRHANVGWTGRRRSWTDDVLWHHGAHVIDLVIDLLNDQVDTVGRLGPVWPESDTAMDFSAVLSTPQQRHAAVSLSYHSQHPIDDLLLIDPQRTFLLDNSTASLYERRDNGERRLLAEEPSADQLPGQVAQATEFLDALTTRRPALTSLEAVFPSLTALDRIQHAGTATTPGRQL